MGVSTSPNQRANVAASGAELSPASSGRADIETLNDLLWLIVERNAARVFLYKRQGQWKTMAAGEVLRQVVRIARGLERLRIGKGDRVALLSENRPEWAVADFAILGRGAVSVPLYPTMAAASYEYILRDCGARALFVSTPTLLEKVRSVWEKLPGLEHAIVFDAPASGRVIFGSTGEARTPPREIPWCDLVGDPEMASSERARFEETARAARPDDLASIMYTSGTTGTPKGVMLTHGNIASNVLAAPVERAGPEDLALSFLPLCHMYERTADYFYMYHAVPIAYAESIEAVPQNLLEVRPTLVAAVPRFFEKMYARVMEAIAKAPAPRRWLFWWALGVGRQALRRRIAGQPIPPLLALQQKLADRLVFRRLRGRLGGRIHYFISGSAPLAPALSEFFNAAGVPICEGYGLTETAPVVACNVPSRIHPGTVGRPIAGVEVRLAPDGEIMVRGPNVMKGYYNLPEETARVLRDGWLYTGDIGEFTPEGDLRVTDRKKDLLKTAGGKYVAPQPIENKLRACACLANAVVLGDRRPYVAALLVPDFDRLAEVARERGIAFNSHAELVRNQQVRELIQQEVEAVNSTLDHVDQVKRWALLDRDFSIDAGELTPTLKVRRRLVEEQYREVIESLYSGATM